MSHVCRFCGDALKTKWGLKLHEDRHLGLSKYSCCDKQFSRKEDLTRHMCSVHGETKEHVCPTCYAEIATKTLLKRHRRREEEEARFKCDVCGAELKQSVDLQVHMHIHSDERVQKCDKTYRYRSSLSKQNGKQTCQLNIIFYIL
ncbi:hypothetical protein DPMN_026481 [Dreissena polymorpha]|uniref:C2H2-type domain-containing protein n=1 Tax=Dreissena polymorpha TaxID=45954 RepID=A0A9D4REC2_DREPO|nr:hypothetical protein DPMN_026481 [Dreissena polymorpha]